MSLEEKFKYISTVRECDKIILELNRLNIISKQEADKLSLLYDGRWGFFSNGDIYGNEINKGILYIEMVYKIVKQAEKEGKL